MFQAIWKTYGDTKTDKLIIMLQSFKEVEFLIAQAKAQYYNVSLEKAVAQFAVDFLK
jgi:S-adenosylmethionine hydrolase